MGQLQTTMQIGRVFVGVKGGITIKDAETKRKPSHCFSFCQCEPCRKCGHEEITCWNCHFCVGCVNCLVFKEAHSGVSNIWEQVCGFKDMLIVLKHKLSMFGIPVDGPAIVFCDNCGVMKNASVPNCHVV